MDVLIGRQRYKVTATLRQQITISVIMSTAIAVAFWWGRYSFDGELGTTTDLAAAILGLVAGWLGSVDIRQRVQGTELVDYRSNRRDHIVRTVAALCVMYIVMKYDLDATLARDPIASAFVMVFWSVSLNMLLWLRRHEKVHGLVRVLQPLGLPALDSNE